MATMTFPTTTKNLLRAFFSTRNLAFVFLLALIQNASAQVITVSTAPNPASIVQNMLVGTGVTISNVKYNGSVPNANATQVNVASFTNTNAAFPFVDGVLLTTGYASVAPGPNNSVSQSNAGPLTGQMPNITDADLSAIAAPNTISNGVFIEFDFVSTGNSITFDYVFGS